MKKLILVCLLALCLLLCACGKTIQTEETTQDKSMFIEVESTMGWQVVYHQDTKVMYAISRGSYNYGNFTLLVNADGTPMTYTGRSENGKS